MKNKIVFVLALCILFIFPSLSQAEITEIQIIGQAQDPGKIQVINFSKDNILPPLFVVALDSQSTDSSIKIDNLNLTNNTVVTKTPGLNSTLNFNKTNLSREVKASVYINDVLQHGSISLYRISGGYYLGQIPENVKSSLAVNDIVSVSVERVASGKIMIGTRGELSIYEDTAASSQELSVELKDEDELLKGSDIKEKTIPVVVFGEVPVLDPDNSTILVPIDAEKCVLAKQEGSFKGQLTEGIAEAGLTDPFYQNLDKLLHFTEILEAVHTTQSHLENPEHGMGTEIIDFYNALLQIYNLPPVTTEGIITQILAEIEEALSNDEEHSTDFEVIEVLIQEFLSRYGDYANSIIVGYQWGFFAEYEGYRDYDPNTNETLNVVYYIFDLIKDINQENRGSGDIHTQAYGDLENFLKEKLSPKLTKLEEAVSPENFNTFKVVYEIVSILRTLAENQAENPDKFREDITALLCKDSTPLPGLCDYLNDETVSSETIYDQFMHLTEVASKLLEDAVTYQDVVHNFLEEFNYGQGPLITTQHVINFLIKLGLISEPPIDEAKFVDNLVKTLTVVENTKAWNDGKIYLPADSVILGFYQDPDDPKDISIVFKEDVTVVTPEIAGAEKVK